MISSARQESPGQLETEMLRFRGAGNKKPYTFSSQPQALSMRAQLDRDKKILTFLTNPLPPTHSYPMLTYVNGLTNISRKNYISLVGSESSSSSSGQRLAAIAGQSLCVSSRLNMITSDKRISQIRLV
ncbi:hypothetical protein QTP88_017251 [Uroleucon formosanum]